MKIKTMFQLGLTCAAIALIANTSSSMAAANSAKTIPISHGLPGDQDGDGVIDKFDKCPNTPPNVIVDANGCPILPDELANAAWLDEDNDGIRDEDDHCPGTPPGTIVDPNGCPIFK